MKGARYHHRKKKWEARIMVKTKIKFLGNFNTQDAMDYFWERFPNKNIQKRKLGCNTTEQLKRITMDAYGSVCSCCGESILEFLTIDVIVPNKNFHQEIGYGPNFYRWLKRNGYPKDNFQCLCMNCNMGKSICGKCPHQENFNCIKNNKDLY